LHLLPASVSASPTVNVGLKASFDRAPYLVELLYVQQRVGASE
jgi:hypothetical protein